MHKVNIDESIMRQVLGCNYMEVFVGKGQHLSQIGLTSCVRQKGQKLVDFAKYCVILVIVMDKDEY